MYGELIPFGGGDPIPLVKPKLLVGRRESCDIVLRFGNVSAHHCEMNVEHGYWFIRDLNSRNGTKVNGLRVTAKKRIDPGDRLSIAKHDYEVRYSPAELGAEGPPPDESVMGEILGQSLMKSAGLDRQEEQLRSGRVGRGKPGETAREAADEFLNEILGVEADETVADDDDTEADDPDEDDAEADDTEDDDRS